MMRRRGLLLRGVALAAGVAGLGIAWWRARSGEASEAALWQTRFEQPGGGELALASLRGQPLLLNFWATWCPPCVTEMPLLDRFQREHGGWRVVGLAVDSPTPVRAFLGLHPVSFAIGLAGLDGVDLARSLGNSSGALPFSVVFDRGGAAVQRKLGALHPEDLQGWSRAVV